MAMSEEELKRQQANTVGQPSMPWATPESVGRGFYAIGKVLHSMAPGSFVPPIPEGARQRQLDAQQPIQRPITQQETATANLPGSPESRSGRIYNPALSNPNLVGNAANVPLRDNQMVGQLRPGNYGAGAEPIRVTNEGRVQVVRGPAISRTGRVGEGGGMTAGEQIASFNAQTNREKAMWDMDKDRIGQRNASNKTMFDAMTTLAGPDNPQVASEAMRALPWIMQRSPDVARLTPQEQAAIAVRFANALPDLQQRLGLADKQLDGDWWQLYLNSASKEDRNKVGSSILDNWYSENVGSFNPLPEQRLAIGGTVLSEQQIAQQQQEAQRMAQQQAAAMEKQVKVQDAYQRDAWKNPLGQYGSTPQQLGPNPIGNFKSDLAKFDNPLYKFMPTPGSQPQQQQDTDTVNAKLTPGEYVLPEPTARAIGVGALDRAVENTTGNAPIGAPARRPFMYSPWMPPRPRVNSLFPDTGMGNS